MPEGETGIDEEVALQAVRDFIARFGTRPTAESWTTAGVTPSHKTIRRRFGSFRMAVAAAGMDPADRAAIATIPARGVHEAGPPQLMPD